MADAKPTTDPQRHGLEIGKDRVIDLEAIAKSRDPETSWQAQGFVEAAAATWFKWLGWLFAAGGVAYLAEITNDRVLHIVSLISQILLAGYAFFFAISIRIEPLWSQSLKAQSRWKTGIGLAVGLVVALVAFFGIRYGMEHIIGLIVESRRSGSG